MARVVVCIVTYIYGPCGVGQGVHGQIPFTAGTQQMYAQLGRILDGRAGAARRIGLPGDHKYIAHAQVGHHVAPGATQPVPSVKIHLSLNTIQAAGRHRVQYRMPASPFFQATILPGQNRLPAVLPHQPRAHPHAGGRPLGKLQRQLGRKLYTAVLALQADGRGALLVLLKYLPRGCAPGNGHAIIHILIPPCAPGGTQYLRSCKITGQAAARA